MFVPLLSYSGVSTCVLGSEYVRNYLLAINYYFCRVAAPFNNMFDYKIREGHCKTRNAISLLESIGLPSPIIEVARLNAEKLDKQLKRD